MSSVIYRMRYNLQYHNEPIIIVLSETEMYASAGCRSYRV